MVFPGFQESIWSYDEQAGEYYFHRFYDFEPDLNLDNPDVRTEVRRIIGYWLELGVAGFRLEAYGYRWYRVGGLDHIIRREKA